jgi:steroid delta-isomerase-like uncharacterized protein
MNLEYANDWCTKLTSDPEAFATLYGEDGSFTCQQHDMDDHMKDTLTTREMLLGKVKQFASGDGGTYTFSAKEWRGDDRWGLLHWTVTIEDAPAFRGVENADGKTLEGEGSTFLQFKPDGTILMDSTFWNDNPIYEQLGVPLVRPHYWEEGFDPASLAG